MNQNYYRMTRILKLHAQYNLLLGERSNGKSYAAKEHCIMQAWKDHACRFVYLRRWDIEIRPSLVEQYFKDAPISVITDGECDGVIVNAGKIYLTHADDQGKPVRVLQVGYTMALSAEQHYKSGAYDDVQNVIFEEVISSSYYLPREPLALMQLISTIARRRSIQVWMIGNTISRMCPYFSEWSLIKTPKQKQGTIETYTYHTDQKTEDGTPIDILIAVEFCENSGNNSKMFFGSSAGMITTGAWECREMPHLPGNRLQEYSCMHTIYLQVEGFTFKAEFLYQNDSGVCCWYVEPFTKKLRDSDRIIVDRPNLYGALTTIGLIPLSRTEQQAFNMLLEGKIFYSDNLTGSDFEACLHKLKNRS